jgi:hypothetical protein
MKSLWAVSGVVVCVCLGSVADAGPAVYDVPTHLAALARVPPAPALPAPVTVAQINALATSVARAVPGANLAAIGAPLHRSGIVLRSKAVPAGFRPSAQLTAALGTSFFTTTSNGSATTITTTPPANVCSPGGINFSSIVFEPITQVTVASSVTGYSGCCGSGCPTTPLCALGASNNANDVNYLHTGDTVTVRGSGFSSLSHEAHLDFLLMNPQQDIVIAGSNIISWTDGQVVFQVPTSLHGMGVQPGMLYLGQPNCTYETTPWFFDYFPTMATQYLSWDVTQYPPPQSGPTAVAGCGVNFTNTSQGDTFSPAGTNPSGTLLLSVGGGVASSGVCWAGFQGFTLHNGWTVAAGFGGQPAVSLTAVTGSAWLTSTPAAGSNNPTINFGYSFGLDGGTDTALTLVVLGEAGTSPTCTSPVDPNTGAVLMGQCQN